MRIHVVVTALVLLTGCASDAGSRRVTAAVEPEAAPAATGSPLTVQEARIAGYKLVDQRGEPVYCREQLKTGSHVRKETICLTAEQLAAAREASQRNVAQMQRATAIPQGK